MLTSISSVPSVTYIRNVTQELHPSHVMRFHLPVHSSHTFAPLYRPACAQVVEAESAGAAAAGRVQQLEAQLAGGDTLWRRMGRLLQVWRSGS